MSKRLGRRPSPSLVISFIALFVALGGTTYAATGGNFILGAANTAGKTTSLRSSVTTGAAFVARNSGGKPAAKFVANMGAAPLSVGHNSTRIAHLNADLLDGKHAKSFVSRCGPGSVAVVALWYAPQLPADPTYVAPNRFGGEGGFACNGGTPEMTKEGTGHYRMRVVTPALPGATGDYILFVNPDARSSTALYAQGLSEIADVWDVYVHDASGNPADPYYMEVQLVAVR